MPTHRYGPVEIHLVAFEGPRPSTEVLDALNAQAESGLVRVLDLVLVSRAEDGSVTADEFESDDADVLPLESAGLIGTEDVSDFADLVPPGSSAALVALELLFAKMLADALAESGAEVVASERIPAPVVNALAELVETDGD